MMITGTGYEQTIVNSALWSAYGDALGFITELRDNPRALVARIGSGRVTKTVAWKRRVGGKFGVEATLPAGCYSDDTELRLATSRAIRPDGTFDVDSFSKIELPVWTSYSLGAGRASKAAAVSLSRDGISWLNNFFDVEGANYLNGGGNGAAMRIQPHIWASKAGASLGDLLIAIVRNSICTHGNMRGIAGAAFHGICLRYVRDNGSTPDIDRCEALVEQMSDLPTLVAEDSEMGLFWLPVWQQRSNVTFSEAYNAVRNELIDDLRTLRLLVIDNDKSYAYRAAVHAIGANGSQQRGSATKTSVLAAYLANLYRDESIDSALICAANTLESDTDTIASMCGAMMGMVTADPPETDLMDRYYISEQAVRLARISIGRSVERIPYPNLLKWKPPRTQQDSVLSNGGRLEVLALGSVVSEGDTFESKATDPSLWQWLELESGQTILAKRRRNPEVLRDYQRRTPASVPSEPAPKPPRNAPIESEPVRRKAESSRPTVEVKQTGQLPFENLVDLSSGAPPVSDIDELTSLAFQSQFDPTVIGDHIKLIACESNGLERALVYSGIIAKAWKSRVKRE